MGAVNIAADANDVSTDRIVIVICGVPCAADDIKDMLSTKSAIFQSRYKDDTHSVEVERML